MRLILLLAVVLGCAAADPFEGLNFADGRQRTLADFHQQGVVLIHFCAS